MRRRADSLCTDRGFTVVELVVLLLVLGVLVAILIPSRPRRGVPYQLREQTNIRSIMQSLAVFADQHAGRYPLPSLLDAANNTVPASPSTPGGEHKDHTANIFSKLVFDAFVPTEMLVSAREPNLGIRTDDDYQLTDPPSAVEPTLALWDPAFSADFQTGVGNVSYAHIIPAGPRRDLWRNTLSATEAAVGNRGPEITGVHDGKPVTGNPRSNTYGFHRPRDEWTGLVGFNDAHVSYFEELNPETVLYTTAAGVETRDTLFYDEPDDANGTNAYLGVFTKAGPTPSDFIAIWD